MKKLILCVIFSIALFIPTAYAANTQVSVNYSDKTITVSADLGDYSREQICSIVVSNSDSIQDMDGNNLKDNIFAFEHFSVNADGVFSKTIKLSRAFYGGKYYLFLKAVDMETPEVTEFTILGGDTLSRFISDMNSGDSEKIAGLLTQQADALNIDISDLEALSVDLCDKMIEMKANLDGGVFSSLEDITNTYKDSAILVYVEKCSTSELYTALEKYKDYLGISTDNQNVSYESIIDIFYVNKKQSYSSIQDVKTDVRGALAVAEVNVSGRGEMTAVLEKYNDVLLLNLDGDYAEYDSLKVNELLVGMNFKSKKEIQTAFEDAVEKVKRDEEKEEENSSRPSGGGGGGGGFVPVTVPENTPAPDTDEENKDEQIQEIQPDIFSDISSGHWAYAAVKALKDKGIVSGNENNEFLPEQNVTREQFVKMLVEAYGINTDVLGTKFKDVDGASWYAKYVYAAAQSGIVSGVTDDKFGVGMAITREDAAAICYRYLKNNTDMVFEGAQGRFVDDKNISNYANEAVYGLYSKGIVSGTDASEFLPKNNLSRAEAAQIIYNMIK